jgi:hypothetical protein
MWFLDIFEVGLMMIVNPSEYFDFAVGVFVFIAFVEVCHSNGLLLFEMGWGVEGNM